MDSRPPSVTTPPATPDHDSGRADRLAHSDAGAEPEPLEFEAARAIAHVEHLAGRIGPRLATGSGVPRGGGVRRAPSSRRRGTTCAGSRSRCRPATPGACRSTPAGRSTWSPHPPGFDPGAVPAGRRAPRHGRGRAGRGGQRVGGRGAAGARPGAARRAGRSCWSRSAARSRSGPGDLHHFGSKFYVVEMTDEERGNLAAMVSLDRVGVGGAVPLSSFDEHRRRRPRRPGAVADRLKIPTGRRGQHDQRPRVVRRGRPARGADRQHRLRRSTTPPTTCRSVVRPAQLDRVGRLLSAWLRGR